jgi:hypothetical protein
MLLGDGDRLVFGNEIKPVQYSLTVTNAASGQVTLDGGLAQGLSRGTRFAFFLLEVILLISKNALL